MSTADNMLKSGFHSLETMGRRHDGPDVEFPELTVKEASSDEFDAFTMNVFGQPQVIVPADPQRTKLSMRNVGSGNLVVGKLSQVSVGAGFLLPPNAGLTDIDTTAPVFVGPDVPNAQTVVKLSVWIERSVG